MLAELTQSLEREGVRLLVTRQIGQVRDVVRRVATDTTPVGVYPTVQAAVQAAQQPPRHHHPGRTGRRPPRSLSMACWTRAFTPRLRLLGLHASARGWTGEGGPSMGALDRRIPNSEQGGVRLKAR